MPAARSVDAAGTARPAGWAVGRSSAPGLAAAANFMAAAVPLDNPRIADEFALSANEIAATQRNLIQTSIISILAAVFIGSIIGLLISRRITNPLLHLDKAAARIKDGDLDTAISIQTEVKEIGRMAETLEQTRVELRQSLVALRQEKAWIDHLLQAIVEGIMILDEDGRIGIRPGQMGR